MEIEKKAFAIRATEICRIEIRLMLCCKFIIPVLITLYTDSTQIPWKT